MSDRQNVAEHGTALCLAALGIAGVGGSLTAAAIPVAVLATWGLDRWAASDAKVLNAARDAAAEALREAGIAEDDLGRALDLFRSERHRLHFDPARWAKAEAEGALDAALVRDLFGHSLRHESPGTQQAVQTVLRAAFEGLRRQSAHAQVFTQDLVRELLADARVQAEFFARHIAPWAGQFFDDLAIAPSASFYRAVAEVGRLLVDIEERAFSLAA